MLNGNHPAVARPSHVQDCDQATAGYEAPQFVELGPTVDLLHGIIEVEKYYDCPASDGNTRYRPNC